MLERLACRLGRKDEVPNIELAESLCASMDQEGIREIAGGLKSAEASVANDCVKVLYEIGQRKPELIAGYVNDFITLLSSKNNRVVWGSMMALSRIAPLRPEAIHARLPEIITAYYKGSVITVDNSISVFSQLCKANQGYQDEIFPFLLCHLQNCRTKEIPQHAERMRVCIDAGNRNDFLAVLTSRMNELTQAQKARLTWAFSPGHSQDRSHLHSNTGR